MANKDSDAGEMEAAGKSEEGDVYETKFKEMQSYIPFLEMMISRLEQNGDKSRQAQLEKMKSLHNILSSTKKKLKLEILQRCEDVLQKLKAKVDKGTGKEKLASPKQKNVDNKTVSNKSTSSSNKKEESPSRKKMEILDASTAPNREKSVNVILTLAARSKSTPLSGEHNIDIKSKGGEIKNNEIQDIKEAEIQDSSDCLADDLDISALIRSRERLKSLLRKQDNTTSPQKSGERLNSPNQWHKNSAASLLDEQELKQISKHIRHHSDSWNRKHTEEENFSSKIRVHSNDLYPDQGSHKPPSMWSPEINSNNFNNISLNSLTVGPLNISGSNLHSPPGTFSHSSGLLSPVQQPQKKALPIIPPLLNVLQYPPAAGSKPLSEADLEELMEDTATENDSKAKEPKKKEESKIRSLRAKLEEEIQQVHRVGISKGGALRGLKKVDDIMKSPVRNKGDPKAEIKKDKSPTISENNPGRKSEDSGLLSPSRRSSGNEIKNRPEESVNAKISDRVLDPRKKGDRDDSTVHNIVENRDPRLKSTTCLEANASKDKNSVCTLQDSMKNKGSILSSLSTQDLQKIVEKNLNNLPLPPPELMENLSLNASAINKPSWQPADIACLSPREFQHQDVHSSGHYGAHFDPTRTTQVPYPQSNTPYNPGYSGMRAEDLKSPLLKPEDPRLKPRTSIPDPRCNIGRDYQNQGLMPSSPYQDSVLRSPASHTESFGSGVLPHSTSHGLRPSGQDLSQSENYGGGLLPPPTPHTTRVVGQEFMRSTNPYHTSHQLYQGNQTGNMPSQSRWAGTPCYGVPSHNTRRAEENFGIRNAPSNVHSSYSAPIVRHDHGFQFMGQSRPAHETYTIPKQPPWQSPSVHGSIRSALPVNYSISGRPIGVSTLQQQQLSTSKPGVSDIKISSTGSGNSQLPVSRTPVPNLPTQNSFSGINSRDGKVSDRDPRRRNSEDQEKGTNRRKVSDPKTHSTVRNVETKRFNERRDRENKRRDSTEPNKVKAKETELVSPLNSLYDSAAAPRTGKGYGLQKFRIPKIKRDVPKEPSPPPFTPPPSPSSVSSKTNEEVLIQADEVKEDTKEKGQPDSDVRPETSTDSRAEGKSSDLKPKEEVTQEWIEALIRKSFESGEAKKYIEQAKLLEKLGESLKGKKLKKIQRILESDSDTNSEEEKSNKQVQENTVRNKTKGSQESQKPKKRSHHRMVISGDENENDNDKSRKENDAPNNESSDRETAEVLEVNMNKFSTESQGDIQDSTFEGEKPVKKYAKRRSALELLQEDIREMFICEGVVTATGHRMCRLLKEAPSDISVDDIVESASRYQDEVSTTAGDSDASSVVSKKLSRKLKEKKYTKKRSETRSVKKNKGKGKPGSDSSNVVSLVNKEDTLSKAQSSNADDSSSPLIKARKKSKWKGYVMESEDSNDDAVPHIEETRERKESVLELEDEDIPLQDILLTRATRAKLMNKSEENNQHSTNFKTEFGRRTRLPRVVIEKTDISKIEYMPTKPQLTYAEETSDEDIPSMKDYASSETEFKPKEKSKQSTRRGKRRTAGRRRRKKAQKHKTSNTSEERHIMENKFVQETIGTDFFYRKKGKRKQSYFLGKKINEVIGRLTLRAQSGTGPQKSASIEPITTATNKNDVLVKIEQESASLEPITTVTDKNGITCDERIKVVKDPEDSDINEPTFSESDKNSNNGKIKNVELQDEAGLKTTRITLNLIRQPNIQKKTKKKKAKWQLGIINHSKKKGSVKAKFDESKYAISGKQVSSNDLEVKCDKESNEGKVLDKQSNMIENEGIGSINAFVPKEADIKMNSIEQDTELQVCDVEKTHNNTNELINSNINENDTDINFTDKMYAFDGSLKYQCKLCPIICRHIVFHYKAVHGDSEVLISRLSEVEAEIAVADSKENNYEEVEQDVKSKIKRRTKKNQRTFCCRICNQICSFAVNFYDHLSSHTGEYRFKCGKCNFKATTRMRVKSHFYSQHPEYKGIESVSTEILAEGPSMDSKYILGYLCSSCNFVQLLKSNLQKHIDLRHNKDAVKAEIICINMSKVKDTLERKSCNESVHTKVEPKGEPAEDLQSNSAINSSTKELITEDNNSKVNSDSHNLSPCNEEKMELSTVNKSVVVEDVGEVKESSQLDENTTNTSVERMVNSDLSCLGIKSIGNECINKNCTEKNIEPEDFTNNVESKCPPNNGENIIVYKSPLGEAPNILEESQNLSASTEIKIDEADKHCTSSEIISFIEETNEVDEKIFVYPDDVEDEDEDGKFEQMKSVSDNLNSKPSSFPSGCDVLQRLLNSLMSENEAALAISQEKTLKEATTEDEKHSHKQETEVAQAVQNLLNDMEPPKVSIDSCLSNKEPVSVQGKRNEVKLKESNLNATSETTTEEHSTTADQEVEEIATVNISGANETDTNKNLDKQENNSNILQRILTGDMENKVESGDMKTPKITGVYSKADAENSEFFSDGTEGSENEDDDLRYKEYMDPQREKESALLSEAKHILNTADPLHRMVDIIENLLCVLSPEQELGLKRKNQEDKQNTAVQKVECNVRPNLSVIPQPPPLIAVDAKEIMARRGAADKTELHNAPIRMGPIIVRLIEGNILFSCCLRGCVFATTKQPKFSNHLETTHKNVRWDGKCKGCLDAGSSKHYYKIKLVEALQHVIEHHVPELLSKSKVISAAEHSIALESNNLATAAAAAREKQLFVNNQVDPTLPNTDEEAKSTVATEPPRQLIRIRRLSGDILSATNKNTVGDNSITSGNQELQLSEKGPENNIMDSAKEGINQTEDEEIPFCKISSVMSLNPNAVGSGDVDVFNAEDVSSSPERSDAAEMEISRTPPDVTSNADISPIGTTCVSTKGIVSPTKAKVLKCTSSYQMCMLPETSLPSSRITVLPTASKLSSIKVNKLSPVKLANIAPKEFTVSSPVSNSLSHSVFSLTRVTQPSELQMARSVLKGKRVSTAVPPYITLKIADGKKSVLPNSRTLLTPTNMPVPASPSCSTPLVEPSLSLVTTGLLEPMSGTPLVNTSVLQPSLQSTSLTDSSMLEPLLENTAVSDSSVLEPSLQTKTLVESSSDSPSVLAKAKIPHKSAVAPSYAKASKVPLYYQEMLTYPKLRHLFKCMAKQCSYTTDNEKHFKEHFTQHAKGNKGSSVKRNKLPGCRYDWQQCVYCCAMFAFAEKLVDHIIQEHGNCLYQCPYCFFRAISASYIVLHQNTCHTNEKVTVLFCNKLECVPEVREEKILRAAVITPYVCQQGSCGAIFYRTDDFQNHLEKEHSQVAIYSCHKCTSVHFRADRLVAHYKLHSCCYYQCIYCVYGSDTKEEMQHHLCNTHPNKPPKIITRSLDESVACDELVPPSTRILDMLKIMDLEEVISGDVIVHQRTESDKAQENGEADPLFSNFQENEQGTDGEPSQPLSPLCTNTLIDKEQEKETDDGSHLHDNSNQETMENKAPCDITNEDCTNTSKESIMENIPDRNKAEIKAVNTSKSIPENNALIVKRGTTQSQNSDVIVLDSSPEDDGAVIEGDVSRKKSEIPQLILPEPLVTLKHRNPETRTAIQTAVDPLSLPDSVPNETREDVKESLSESMSHIESVVDDKCSLQQKPEPSEPLSDSTKTGFSGCALYRCGYASCAYSADTSSLLKDHLCACDMARDSPSLICVHCRKQFKHVGTLMEHLRTHGTNRFKCSLCDFQAPVPHQVAKHLKQKHRVTSTKVVPLNPLESDPETAKFVVIPKERLKGKKNKAMSKEPLDSSNKTVFLPEELEHLPHQAIFTTPLQCATCKYETKVRSNLYRHLQLHTLSTDEPVDTVAAVSADPSILPNSAPVNPVPCLETNEMMFDKMTNLALSSHMGNITKAGDGSSGNSKTAEDIEAKLPKFVPEHQRYVCGAPNCSYLTVDDTMLRYHLRALHFDQTSYRCPHCPEAAQDSNFHIPIERMGAHLKMHDSRLYKCAHCMYNHFQRHVVERHLADKHPEKRPYVHVVREPETEAPKVDDTASTSIDTNSTESAETIKNPWHCGLCKHQSATRADVLDHTWTVHGVKSQYKCGLCTFRSSSRASLDTHSLAKHPDSTVEVVHVYRKVDAPKTKSPSKSSFSQEGTTIDAHPVWRRDDSKLRHIRGIFLDDEVQTSAPVKQSYNFEVNAGEDEKYGQCGEPFGDNFVCPRCLKYRSKYRTDFRDHLYRELQYKKWICTHCNLMSCNRNTVMRHSSKIHEREGKSESILALPADEEIEAWVRKVINTQSYIMKHGSSARLPSVERLLTEPETSSKDKLTDKPNAKGMKSEEPVLKLDDDVSVDEESINSAPPSSQKVKREKRYACKRCGLKFSMRRGLKLHIRINHLKLGKWMCAYCDFITNAETILLQHCNLRHPELPLKCLPNNRGSTEILDDAFWDREFGLAPETETSATAVAQKRKASITEDQEGSEDGTISCQQCDYSCHTPKDMKQHMIKHWVQKPFKCGYCDFEGVREYDIKKHSAKLHPMKKFRITEGSGAGKADIRQLNKRFKSKASRSDADGSTTAEGSDDEIKDDSNEDEANEGYSMYRCYYCPQRGTTIAVIHQHWEEKHKNGSITSNGIIRYGLPFKYKEVNLKQYIKGEDNAAGRRPSLQCAYCDFRGNHALLEVHHRSMHFDKQFKINRSGSTRYECAVCHFAAFTVNTLKRHFDMEHVSEEFRYIVRTANEETMGSSSGPSPKLMDRSSPLPVSSIEITKYMCLWCEKTYDSEIKIQSHHSSQHSSLQLKYSVEKISAPLQLKASSIPSKRYQCPCCSFSSNNYTGMCEHLRRHVKPYLCGYCGEGYESPAKLRVHLQQLHPGCKYKAEYSSDAEAEYAGLKSDILINASDAVSEPVRTPAKRENSGDRIGSAPKKLCVARKSTGSAQGKKLHAVARKSTTYLPWQRSPSSSPSPPLSDSSDIEDNVDQESITSSVGKPVTQTEEFSFYGRSPSPVDTNRITTYVKLKKYGISMNMNIATMEKFTKLYPVVKVRKLVFF